VGPRDILDALENRKIPFLCQELILGGLVRVNLRPEVFTAVGIEIEIFWAVTLYL
jgi:hypothetical protein